MCGIAGIIALDPRAQVDRARLIRMRDSLVHRGPDGAGLWTEGGVGLSHRRLSIVDLAAGQQPMQSNDGNAVVVFNGEIYNHAKLRPALEELGHRYRTHSDTETILHLYEERGERCVEALGGMFAFALWDRRQGALLLARDRLGIKPLYYAISGSELFFASEIKAILAAGFPAELNAEVLPDYLANRFVGTEETFFKGIRKLMPGRTLRWTREGGFSERRYWHLPVTTDGSKTSLRDWASAVRTRLHSAVESQLMADVPLGLFLSGGLDSSGLAGLMAPLMRGPLQTFSVGFAEEEANELSWARLAARTVGAEHRDLTLTSDDFFSALPGLVWHEDEPIAFPSSVPLYFVAKLARKTVKVVLTGEGADELFLGYNKYRVAAWNDRLARACPSAIRGLFAALARRLPSAVRRYTDRSFLAVPAGLRAQFYENFSVFSQPLQESLLARSAQSLSRDPHAVGTALLAARGGGELDQMSHADLQTYLVELLMKQDQMSMAASLESRVPFLDHELVEQVVSIPARFKLRGTTTKAVLREALADVVPRPILTRKKMGFPVPVGRWLRGAHWPLVQDLVLSPRALARGHFRPAEVHRLAHEHHTGMADHGDRLWLLVNLELWQRLFLDGDASALQRAA